MKNYRRIAVITLAAIFSTINAVAAAPGASGTFALNAGRAKVVSKLSAVATAEKLTYAFDIVQSRPGSNETIRDYNIDNEKIVHLIAVSDDLQTFTHLHPTLFSDGHLRGTFAMPRAARYFAFVDSSPVGLGQQVFRFPVTIGDGRASRAHLGKPNRTSMAGPYRVTLDADVLKAGKEAVLKVHLAKGKLAASDLHGYLGGAAHAVFINAKTLTYAHVHPTIGEQGAMAGTSTGGDMGAMKEAPAIADTARVPAAYQLHVGAQVPGRYRLWLQFRGGKQIYVAPFVIDVR